jgi:hypothetical protein
MRHLEVYLFNQNRSVVSAVNMLIEQELRKISTCSFYEVKDLNEVGNPCDLVICLAHFLESDHFLKWISSAENRMPFQNGIKLPLLVVADLEPATLRDLISLAQTSNWYFDVVSSNQIGGLSLRMLNFFRLHDHLKEIQRMNSIVEQLQQQVKSIEESVIASLAKD